MMHPSHVTSDATTGTSTHQPAGMADGGYEWEKAVIAHWCGVQVLDVHVEPTTRTIGQDTVAVIEIVATVRTTQDAHALAALLDLPAAPPDPDVAWQSWTGWASVLSAHQPVLVTVTAPTTHREAS